MWCSNLSINRYQHIYICFHKWAFGRAGVVGVGVSLIASSVNHHDEVGINAYAIKIIAKDVWVKKGYQN